MSAISDTPIYLYNTLSRRKERFEPVHAGRAGIYACGPTVYKDIHTGNFRTFVMTDWLRRVLEYNGYEVYLVRNITDVGHMHDEDVEEGGQDKLEAEARKTGRSAWEIAEHYTRQYMRDSDDLNILRPHVSPKATDHIPEMQDMTEKLIQKGLAYVSGGNVYYDVSRYPLYGELSGNTVENLRAGASGRVQLEMGEGKKAPEDFALWKEGEPSRQMNWESPWGTGFPGWHIECSAMATKYLGQQFDIHTGAIDLIFPHHEDEIAQSRGISGEEPVRYWVHGEFLNFNYRDPRSSAEAGEGEAIKMSRSKGNVVLLQDLKTWGIDPMAFRYLLLTAHYRTKLNFTNESIAAAQNGLNNLRETLAALPVEDTPASGWSAEAQRARVAFHTAINDDIDLPTALSITLEAARDSKISPAERRRLVLDFDRVLGLRLDTVEARKPILLSSQAVQPDSLSEEARALPAEIVALVRERYAARKAKDWKRSDDLRNALIERGYEVRDTPQGLELVKR